MQEGRIWFLFRYNSKFSVIPASHFAVLNRHVKSTSVGKHKPLHRAFVTEKLLWNIRLYRDNAIHPIIVDAENIFYYYLYKLGSRPCVVYNAVSRTVKGMMELGIVVGKFHNGFVCKLGSGAVCQDGRTWRCCRLAADSASRKGCGRARYNAAVPLYSPAV